MRDPFKVLGIEPTSDKKQIKKAYAKLAARYHPEEYPEKWQEIHEAYEAAIQFASAIGEDAWTEEEEQKKSDSFSGLENRAEADSIVVWEENTEQKTAVEVSAEKEYIDKDAVPESVPEAISWKSQRISRKKKLLLILSIFFQNWRKFRKKSRTASCRSF